MARVLGSPSELIHPDSSFAVLYDNEEGVFPPGYLSFSELPANLYKNLEDLGIEVLTGFLGVIIADRWQCYQFKSLTQQKNVYLLL